MATLGMSSGPGRSFSFWADHGRHFTGSAWFPLSSARWDSPPVATILHTCWDVHPLQGDFATCPIKRWCHQPSPALRTVLSTE